MSMSVSMSVSMSMSMSISISNRGTKQSIMSKCPGWEIRCQKKPSLHPSFPSLDFHADIYTVQLFVLIRLFLFK